MSDVRVHHSSCRLLALCSLLLITSCGGEILGAATGDAGEQDGGTADANRVDSFVCVEPVDCARSEPTSEDARSMTEDAMAEGSVVVCEQVGRNALQNGSNCSMSTVEKCNDGVKYEASCSCESKMCGCSANEMNMSVPFDTPCTASCVITAAGALRVCGFPF
jgi:hypothetical protein